MRSGELQGTLALLTGFYRYGQTSSGMTSALEREGDYRERRERECHRGHCEPYDQRSGDLIIISPMQCSRDAVLAHRADHQDRHCESSVAETQQPQWPAGTSCEAWQDSTDGYRHGSGAQSGTPPSEPHPLRG